MYFYITTTTTTINKETLLKKILYSMSYGNHGTLTSLERIISLFVGYLCSIKYNKATLRIIT